LRNQSKITRSRWTASRRPTSTSPSRRRGILRRWRPKTSRFYSASGNVSAAAPQRDGELVEYGTRRWLIVVGVMGATLLQVLDATIVNVALPTIQGNVGANFDQGAWIVT